MYKVETHNNSREYYEQLIIEDDAVYIAANTSLSNMIKEVGKVSIEDRWRVLDIENFIKYIYPNWTSTINEIKLKGEIRKSIYLIREGTIDSKELNELRFLEDNISVLYDNFKIFVEAGISEINNTYEGTKDTFNTESNKELKIKLIKKIFNIFTKSELFKDISIEVLKNNNITNFEQLLIQKYLEKMKESNENNPVNLKGIIEDKRNTIKKVYFYNINNLDLRRFLLAEKLRENGFDVVFRIPYFAGLNVVNKCWNMVYNNDVFNINTRSCSNASKEEVKYIYFLEGREVKETEEKIFIKNYREVYDFKKKIKDKNVITLYKDSLKSIMDRDELNIKNHCYQSNIGRFIYNLYNCNVDGDEIKIDFDTYREMITSGWVEVKGWNGLRLHSYLVDNAEYFSGVSTLNEIIYRIEKLRDVKEVSNIFNDQVKDRVKKNLTKQFLSNPFKAFGYIDVEKYKVTANNMLEVTLKLKRFLIKVFEQKNGLINLENHFSMMIPLFKNKYIVDVFKNGSKNEKDITRKIFAVLSNWKDFGEELHKDEICELFGVKLVLDNPIEADEQEEDFSIDQLEGLIYRDKLLRKNNGKMYLGDMSYKAYEKYVEKFSLDEKILSFYELKIILANNVDKTRKSSVMNGLQLQSISKKSVESYFKFALANLLINYNDIIEFSWIEGLRKDDSKAIVLKQIEAIYGKSVDIPQFLDSSEFVDVEDINFDFNNDYNKKDIVEKSTRIPDVALRDLDFCGDKLLYSSILEGHPEYYSDFHHRLAFGALISIFKNNIEDGYSNIYKYVLPLFPQWKDIVKKNILDCEFSRNGLREYRFFEGINYPKAIDVLYLLKSKYIVTENNKIRNRYNKGEFNGERYYKEFLDEFLKEEQNNNGLHCRMCPHCYLCKKGEFVIDSK